MDNNNSSVAWIALAVAVVALILGWTAFNRSGENVGELAEREAQEAAQSIDEASEAAQRAAQEAEQEARDEAAKALQGAADDVSTDEDPNNTGE